MDHNLVFQDCYEEDHTQYKKIFAGNQEFVQEKLLEDSSYFAKLAKGQTPKYLIIGCSDSRVPPNDLTKLKPGDIFNHRNIANQVLPADMNVNSVIQYAIEHLKVKHVVVMGHTFCGGIKGAIEGNSHGGILDLWLSNVKNVYEKYQEVIDAIEDMNQKVTKLCEFNVVEQVKNVWKNPYVQKSWKKGHPVWVHGWVFRMESGQLDEIVVETHMPAFLRVFQFNFEDSKRHSVHDPHGVLRQSVHSGGSRKSILLPNLPIGHHDSHRKSTFTKSQTQDQQEVGTPRDSLQKKNSIWNFDDFLAVQSELMLKTDISGMNLEKFNINELVEDEDQDENDKEKEGQIKA